MKVSDVMSTNIVSIDPQETAAAAARLLARHNVGVLPVCKGGKLQGVVTDRDLVLRCVAAGLAPDSTVVGQVMTRRVVSVSPQEDVAVAAQKMAAEQVRRLPVVENRMLVGLVSLGDLAKQPDYSMEAAACLCDVCENITAR